MLCGCHGNLDETGQCRCRQLGQVSANAERENGRTERTDCPPPGPSGTWPPHPSSSAALEGQADGWTHGRRGLRQEGVAPGDSETLTSPHGKDAFFG